MWRLFKCGMTIVAILVLVLALPFIINGCRFFTHRSEILSLLNAANPEEKRLPPLVHDMLAFSFHGKSAPYASQLVIWRLDKEHLERQQTLSRVIAEVSWRYMLDLYTSEDERLTLIAELAPTGEVHRGLFNTSMAIFGRPLSGLNDDEAAILVLLVRGGNYYKKPENMTPARRDFLERYRARRF